MAETIFTHAYKLWLFTLVARERSLRKAALAAGITPSAVSQALAALELYLGQTLLIRGGDTLDPTSEGRLLLERAGPALESLGALAPESRAGDPLKIRLGAYESIAMNFLPSLLPRLRARCPAMRIEIRTARSHVLSTLVGRGELDFAMVAEHPAPVRLESHEFARERLGLFASSSCGMGWEAVKRLGIGTLATAPDGQPRYLQRFMKSIDSRTPIAMRSDSFETLRSLCESGVLASVLPVRVAGRGAGALREIRPEGRELELGEHRFLLISRRNADARIKEALVEELGKSLAAA